MQRKTMNWERFGNNRHVFVILQFLTRRNENQHDNGTVD